MKISPTVLPSSLLTLGVLLMLAGGCDEIKTSDHDLVTVGERRVAEAVEDPATAVIDVRTRERYAEGHIPTAINIPLPELRAGEPQLAEAQRIIVYGRGWRDPLSSAAAKRLIALGYSNVEDFRGGVELWQDSGLDLVTAPTAAEEPADEPAEEPADP